MKTLIAFSSKYGTTEKCAELVKKGLEHTVDLVNLKSSYSINMKEYDTVIIGGSIYAGGFQKEAKKFIENNKEDLLSKKIGLFVCCKDEGEKAVEYLKNNLPESIFKKALFKEHLGHEVNIEKMKFFDKLILKAVAKVDKSYSDIKTENIEKLVMTINGLDGISG